MTGRCGCVMLIEGNQVRCEHICCEQCEADLPGSVVTNMGIDVRVGAHSGDRDTGGGWYYGAGSASVAGAGTGNGLNRGSSSGGYGHVGGAGGLYY